MAHRQWVDAASLATKAKNEAYINYQKKYEQMTKQQQLIEQKKQEIIKKQEEKKKKETEEALKKLNEDKLRSSESSRSKRGYHGYSKKSGRDRPEVQIPAGTLPSNIFSNDGSFLEQFQKISGVRVDVKKRSSGTSSKQTSESNKGGDAAEEPDAAAAVENEDAENSTNNEKESSIMDTIQSQQMVQQQQQQQQVQPQQQLIQPPQQMVHPQMQQHQMPHPQMQQMQHHQMPLPPHMQHPLQMHPQRPPVFTPQQMRGLPPMSPGCQGMPPMGMNYPHQFNPMMLPPPMTPSSIPPPAPLNPGSIPSPLPLQPGSIPSPSPLQPYAIPPPSPLIPHSIPPPSPMVPHSIPPPSPMTPHSIPPPLPIRPQNIPPPVQRPPLFLSMVTCPPPPPPPEEEKPNPEPTESEKSPVSIKEPKHEDIPEPEKEPKEYKLAETAKELFDRNDYSSSSSSEDEEEKSKRFGPPNKRSSSSSNSDSEPGRRSPDTDSDKESDGESYRKEDDLSEMDSTMEQESQPVPETESEADSVKMPKRAPVVIEDTQTQFPSDTKDSSNTGDPAPPDLCSEGEAECEAEEDSQPPRRFSDHQTDEGSQQASIFVHQEVKEEPQDFAESSCDMKQEEVKQEETFVTADGYEEVKHEVKVEVKEESKPGTGVKPPLVKMEFVPASKTEDSTVKSEEPPTKKKRRSRWASEDVKVEMPTLELVSPAPQPHPGCLPAVGMVLPMGLGTVNTIVPPLPPTVPTINVPGMSGALISKVSCTDPALVAYAMKAFGRTNLTSEEWKKAEDHYKINLLYQDMMRKREEVERLAAAGRQKYEYDSDEDCEGGTWEHKLRNQEMVATQLWADELTEAAKGKHHIGDFLPPDELSRFMEKYEALKEGREPDLSDYKEFKLKEDNIGFQMLQKLGWTEGQGLGADGSGIVDPVSKSSMRTENQGLGMERPDDVDGDDDEYDAYRKRMMLAYRFRPNPMNNPRRPYY